MVPGKEFLINPFRRVAGGEALFAGFGIMLLTAAIAWQSSTHFDGVLDSHTGSLAAPAWVYFTEPFIAWACALSVFGLVATLGSGSRFRWIDLAGTLALSRAPMLLAAILGFAVPRQTDPVNISPTVLLLAIPLIGILVWTIVLMFQAFKVSIHPKAGRAGLLFSIAIIVAEVLSKFVFHAFYSMIL